MYYRQVYGPRDASVLCRQSNHRSEQIVQNVVKEEDLITPYYTANSIFWSFRLNTNRKTLHPRVLDVLDRMGLLRVARCGALQIDHHLITALIERWRGETHTFHFPFGEATVTLQDVGLIWGLRITGEPLISDDTYKSKQQWSNLLYELIGFRPGEGDIKGLTQLKLKALSSYLKNIDITDETPAGAVEQYARGCALLMIGCFMMPNSSRSRVSLVYLPCLRHINVVGGYSWGSAVLASLYRELCTAAEREKEKSVGGAMSLLQIWAWSRIIPTMPDNVMPYLYVDELIGEEGRVLASPPLGVRWLQFHDHTSSVSHSLRQYRDCFDRLREEHFIWEPYNLEADEVVQLGPTICTPYWRAYCPLINMWIVELHHPERVLRQFGAVQGIPMALNNAHQKEHADTLSGNPQKNWLQHHQHWIGYWHSREPVNAHPILPGQPNTTPEYMQWYRQITRLLISPARYHQLGFQPASVDARVGHLDDLMGRLVVNATDATIEDPATIEVWRNTSFEVAQAWQYAQRMPPTFAPGQVPHGGIPVPAQNEASTSRHPSAGPHTGGQFNVGTSMARHSTAGHDTGGHFQVGTSMARHSTAGHDTGGQFNAGPSTSRHSVSGSTASRSRRRRVERRDDDLLASSNVPVLTSAPIQTDPAAYMGTHFQQPEASFNTYTPDNMTFTSLLQSGIPPGEYSGGVNYMSSFVGPRYAASPVPYPPYETGSASHVPQDMNVDGDAQAENLNVEQGNAQNPPTRRSTRTRQPPPCGTGGRQWLSRLFR